MMILIIEDDKQCRQMMSDALEDLGVEVLTADGPENSLPLLCLPSVDGVICDRPQRSRRLQDTTRWKEGKDKIYFATDKHFIVKCSWRF